MGVDADSWMEAGNLKLSKATACISHALSTAVLADNLTGSTFRAVDLGREGVQSLRKTETV